MLQQETEHYWEINCDGYYPYCPFCLKEPDYCPADLPSSCPHCGAKLKHKTYYKADWNEILD